LVIVFLGRKHRLDQRDFPSFKPMTSFSLWHKTAPSSSPYGEFSETAKPASHRDSGKADSIRAMG